MCAAMNPRFCLRTLFVRRLERTHTHTSLIRYRVLIISRTPSKETHIRNSNRCHWLCFRKFGRLFVAYANSLEIGIHFDAVFMFAQRSYCTKQDHRYSFRACSTTAFVVHQMHYAD